MITLIEGGFYAGGREAIKARIKALCENEKKSILIVPEQDTVSSEDELSSFLPNFAPLFTEVTNFTRFSDVIFRSLGGSCNGSADAVKRALIMWKTLNELSQTLKSSAKNGEISHGVISKTLMSIKEMQSFAISARDLESAEKEISTSF